MKFIHVALTCSSEKNADKFYKSLLGCQKSGPKILPSSLSSEIFNIDSELTIFDYKNEYVHFEIFIYNRHRGNERRIDHVCLQVADMGSFLERCKSLNVMVIQVPKGGSVIIFAGDDDGNLFEIKQV